MKRLSERLFEGRHVKLRILSFGVIAFCLMALAYGLTMYPDAPYHPCAGGPICGKSGHHYSYHIYRDWQIWEITLILSWPLGLSARFLLKCLRTEPT
jgi:hypothetical protein